MYEQTKQIVWNLFLLQQYFGLLEKSKGHVEKPGKVRLV
jgi:hypothetical protein